MTDTAPRLNAASFLYLATATVLGLALGDFSQDLARWIVCAGGTGRCTDAKQAEAQTIATLVATFLAVYLAAQAARTGAKSKTEARLLIIGAMAGALLAVLKAAEGDRGYPEPDTFLRPLLVWVLGLAVFFFPMWQASGSDGKHLWPLYHRLVLTFLVAAGIGTLLQVSADLLWTAGADNSSSRKFVVAPVVPVIGGAVLGALMQEGRPGKATLRRVLVWGAVSVLTVTVWTVAAYLPAHATGTGWVARSGMPVARVGAAYGALMLSGVCMMAVLAGTGTPLRPTATTLSVVAAACVAAAVPGAELGLARMSAGKLAAGNVAGLALLHAAGPLCVWLSAVLAARLNARLLPPAPD